MIKKYIPGMRNIKTAISVVFCMLTIDIFNSLIGYDIPSLYAGAGAVFATGGSKEESHSKGKARVLGTVIGGIIGITFYYLNYVQTNGQLYYLLSFIGMVLMIQICNLLKIPQGIMGGSIAFLASTGTTEYYFPYIILRTVETTYGVIIGILINTYLFPYRSDEN